MKTETTIFLQKCAIALLLLCVTASFAQTFPNPEQDIFQVNSNSSVIESHLSDLDGDGDLDLISSYGSNSSNTFFWFENLDGLGNYGAAQNVVSTTIWMTDIYTSDIDGDGDMDIITASSNSGDVYWLENLDGLGTFGALQVIAPNEYGANEVFTADMDGDGDLDVLSASFLNNRIAWYENLDGLGNFGPQQIIITSPNYMVDVYAADIDGDGSMDVLSASKNDNRIAWYKNDGTGSFGSQQTITTNASEARFVFAADLDGDGDNDVLSGSFGDNRIAWYENTDGLGNFGAQQVIYDSGTGLRDIKLVDLDGDGDLDVVSAYSYTTATPHEILWHENKINCSGSFAPEQIIDNTAFAVWKVSAGDIDGDGDVDVLGSYSSLIRVAWYENITTPTISEYLPETLYICNENFEELCGPPSIGCNYTYNWYYNNPTTQTASLVSTTQCYTPNQYGEYVLVVEDENGNFTHYYIEVLNALPQPVLGVNGEICKGELISIAGQGFDTNDYDITWFHNGNIVQQGGTVLTTSFSSGTITVQVSYKKCKGVVTASVKIINCCSDVAPILGVNGEVCKGELISIAGQGFDSGAYQITWFHNGNIVQQGGTTLMTSYTSGIITLLIEQEGCKEVLKEEVKIVYCNEKEVVVYPNPVKDLVKIDFNEISSGDIKIMDKAGILVLEKTFVEQLNYTVDMSKFKSDIYIVKVIMKDKVVTVKVIKE